MYAIYNTVTDSYLSSYPGPELFRIRWAGDMDIHGNLKHITKCYNMKEAKWLTKLIIKAGPTTEDCLEIVKIKAFTEYRVYRKPNTFSSGKKTP